MPPTGCYHSIAPLILHGYGWSSRPRPEHCFSKGTLHGGGVKSEGRSPLHVELGGCPRVHSRVHSAATTRGPFAGARNNSSHRNAMGAAARAVLLLCSLSLASARVLLEVLPPPPPPATDVSTSARRSADASGRTAVTTAACVAREVNWCRGRGPVHSSVAPTERSGLREQGQAALHCHCGGGRVGAVVSTGCAQCKPYRCSRTPLDDNPIQTLAPPLHSSSLIPSWVGHAFFPVTYCPSLHSPAKGCSHRPVCFPRGWRPTDGAACPVNQQLHWLHSLELVPGPH